MGKCQMSRIFGTLLVALVLHTPVAAQELEPRSMPQKPVRLHALSLSYAYSSGNIILDMSLPLEDVTASINSLALAYVTTFGLAGRIARIGLVLPVAFGTWEGLVEGDWATTSRAGLGDPMVGFAINIYGVPMRLGQTLVPRRTGLFVGVGLNVRLPLGQYNGTKLINLGTNRWIFEPRLGVAVQIKRWILETRISSWFFTTNNQFFHGNSLSQSPLHMLQLHVIHEFRSGIWIAVSGGVSRGGRASINGEKRDTLQRNSRVGATLSIPLGMKHGLSLAYTSGISTRYGANFDNIILSYQFRWLKFK